MAYVEGASHLFRDFIDVLCNPRNISLFSPLFSPLHYSLLFFPLSFIHSPTRFLLRISLDPAGAGPRHQNPECPSPLSSVTKAGLCLESLVIIAMVIPSSLLFLLQDVGPVDIDSSEASQAEGPGHMLGSPCS